jgi:hypothetical protein
MPDPDPSRSFDLMPDHRCEGEIIGGVIAETPKNADIKTGKMLTLTHKLTSGPFAGRLVWNQFNYENPSAQAQEIAQIELKKVCKAVGFEGHLTDDAILYGIPMLLRVGIKAGSGGFLAKNIIKEWKPLNENAPPRADTATVNKPTPATPAPARAAAPAKAGAAKPMPWKK